MSNPLILRSASLSSTIIPILLFAVGFFASQRFYGGFSHLVCVLPFIVAITKCLKGQSAVEYLLLALVFLVDNGVNVYAETPALIRYPIYLFCLYTLARPLRLRKSGLIIFFVATSIWLLMTLIALEKVSSSAMFRDVYFLVILGLLLSNSSPFRLSSLNFDILVISIMGFLVGELFNSLMFFSSSSPDYMSYDTLKGFVVLPSLFYLARKDYIRFALFSSITLLVLLDYRARMIPVVWTVLIFATLMIRATALRGAGSKLASIIVLLIIPIMLFYLGEARQFAYDSNKVTNLIYVLLSNTGGVVDAVYSLDPVRVAEHKLFFSRPLVEIIFGSGLSAGLHDNIGALSFVGFNDSAFSRDEITSGYYYNLHDVWIDYGLRFGIIFVLCVFILLGRAFFSTSSVDVNFISMMLIVSFFTSFYSIAGMLVIAILSSICFDRNRPYSNPL